MNFRKHTTASGTKIVAGKDAEQNEKLMKNVNDNDIIFHTASPGSPFCIIKKTADKKDIKEAALFCAKYSQEYKKAMAKHDIKVSMFKGKDVFKEKQMKIGTFGVKKFKTITAKKEDIEKLK